MKRLIEKDTNGSLISGISIDSNAMAINFEAENLPSTSVSFQILENGQRYVNSSTVNASVSNTTAINFAMGNSSDDSNSRTGTDDSPRKRQRKQQFDNSQQDKLMVKFIFFLHYKFKEFFLD